MDFSFGPQFFAVGDEFHFKMSIWDGCCQHPSPLLVNTWNTWAWVTDAGSIRHLVWSNIAWVTDFADYFVCVCVSPSF